ncbi:MAG: hypothetical protein ACK4M5_02150, partial [Dietzia cercidiphylli]
MSKKNIEVSEERLVEEGEVAALPAYRQLVERTAAAGGRVHLLGLLSPGGVHSHERHLFGLIAL